MKKILLSAVIASSLIVAANAEDTAYISHAELGYVNTSGNTDTETFGFDGSIKKGWGKHGATLKADASYGKDGDRTTKKKAFAELSYDYALTKRLAFNYVLGYKYDAFSAFDYQAYTGPGLKYKAIIEENQTLDLTASLLYSLDNNNAPGSSDSDSYSAYKLEAEYMYAFSKNVKFTQDLSYRASFEESEKYFVFSKTALTTKVSDMFSAGISYKVDYTNEANILNKEYSDKTLLITLILDY
jgi:putative salt-induced outer membrane protein